MNGQNGGVKIGYTLPAKVFSGLFEALSLLNMHRLFERRMKAAHEISISYMKKHKYATITYESIQIYIFLSVRFFFCLPLRTIFFCIRSGFIFLYSIQKMMMIYYFQNENIEKKTHQTKDDVTQPYFSTP